MPIKVSCKCGQSFAVKDELAGKTLKCPKCQQALPIPAAGAVAGGAAAGRPAAARPAAPQTPPAPAGQLAGLFDEAGFKEHKGPRCPQCAEPLANPNAVLCTHCGFHLQSGQKFEGAKVYKTGERGHAEAADDLLIRAEKQIEVDKVEAKKNLGTGMPAWVLFLALAALCGFVAAMFLIPRHKAFHYTGLCIAGFGGLMSAYYGIRMLIAAFQESTTCGLLYVFMPFYQLYYLITRWDKVGGLFLMNLIYNFVTFAGMGMMAVAPSFNPANKEGGDGESFHYRVESVPAVARADGRRPEQAPRRSGGIIDL